MRKNKTKEEINTFIKNFIIGSIITLLVCGLLAVLTGVIVVNVLKVDYEKDIFRVYGDSFFVSGILVTLFRFLLFVSQAGAFDIIVYSVRKMVNYFFKKNPEDSDLPKTYYDYVALKREKKKNIFPSVLFISMIFLIIGIILSSIATF